MWVSLGGKAGHFPTVPGTADPVTYQPEGYVQRKNRNQSGTSRRHLRSGHWTEGWHTHPSRHSIRGSSQCGTGPCSAGSDQVLTTRQLAEGEAPVPAEMGEKVN